MNKLKKFAALALIVTHITVFNTHDFALADTSGRDAAFSKDGGFASFDAASASQADLFTGSASTSIPIFIPPGRKGLQPNVALSYSSSGGNSWCGTGWNLDFGSIQRSTKGGVPSYDDNDDTFMLNFGGSSELVSIGGNEYRMKHEALFMRVIKNTDSWTVTDKSGTTYTFGATSAARMTNSYGTYSWHLDRVEDKNGNYMTYTYTTHTHSDGGKQIYPASVDYNGHAPTSLAPTHHVTFTLEDRNDITFAYNSRARITTAKRLKQIDVRVGTNLARKYVVSYTYSPSTNRTLITAMQEFGTDGTSTLPPIEFEYGELDKAFGADAVFSNVQELGGTTTNALRHADYAGTESFTVATLTDINGDGRLDHVVKSSPSTTTMQVQLGKQDGTGFENPITWSPVVLSGTTSCNYLDHTNAGETNQTVSLFMDVNADGLPDRIMNDVGDVEYWNVQFNIGTGFENTRHQWYRKTPGEGSHHFSALMYASDSADRFTDFFDIDGDGCPDRVVLLYDDLKVQHNNGATTGDALDDAVIWSGYDTSQMQHILSNTSVDGSSCVDCLMIDINGDGYPDRVFQTSTSNTYWYVQFNNGRGFEATTTWSGVDKNGKNAFAYMRSYKDSRSECDLMDINADGLPDRVMQTTDGSTTYKVQLNTGSGFAATTTWTGLDNDGSADLSYLGYTDDNQNTALGLYDINSDGLVDRVKRDTVNTTQLKVQHQTGDMPDLIKTIHNGRGGSTTFAYKPSTRYDNTGGDGIADLGFPIQTVESITLDDGMGNAYTTSYGYESGKYDYEDKEFRGFAKVTVTDPDGNYTTNCYYQDDTYQGKLYQKEVRNAAGDLFARTKTTWASTQIQTGVTFVYVDTEDEYTFEGDVDYRRRRTSFAYDSYGNLTQTNELGEFYEPGVDPTSNVLGDERTTIHTYTYNTTDRLLNTLAKTELRDANGIKIAEKFFYYDSATSYTAQPVKGNLTKEEEWYAAGANPTTTMTYDTYGNIQTISDSRGYVTTNTYDTTYHQFLLIVENALGHTQQFTYDACLAKIKTTVDANGVVTETIYDAFGRPLKVIEPGDSATYPTKQFYYRQYASSNTLERVRVDVREESGTNNVLTSYAFFDGLGRKIQTRIESERAGEQIVMDNVTFNARGNVSEQFVPYFEDNATEYVPISQTSAKSTFEYDSVGRKIKTTLPDGSFTQTSYDDWEVTATTNNELLTNEQKAHRAMDAYGRVVAVTEFNGGAEYVTTYEYDARDNLVVLTDSLGNTTGIEYDSLGRKVWLDDPDTGITTYTYDANGNLSTQTDANANVITFAYDALNRVMSKVYSDATPSVSYNYDNASVPYGKGRLTEVTNGLAATSFKYDERGRVVEETQVIDSAQYTYAYVYDTMGRKKEIAYPDGQIVVYSFNTGGSVEKVGLKIDQTVDDDYFVMNVDYNAAGQMEIVEYGNGVTTDYTYDAQTMRLTRLQTRDINSGLIQDLQYGFDNNGNVKSIVDSVNSGTQFFTYDALNRLTQAVGSYGAIAYSYDAIGNMLSKGGTTFTYGGSGVGPHMMTGSSDGRTFQYDACGNMTFRGQDELTFDADNRMTHMQTYKGEAGTDERTLVEGWNVISFPYLPDDTSVDAVMGDLEFGVDYDQVSTFDSETGEWQHWVNDGEFSDFFQIKAGKAYWVSVIKPGGITLSVEGRLTDRDTETTLFPGNNYFGIVNKNPVPVADLVAEGTFSELKTFDVVSGDWSTFTGDTFSPGVAYCGVVGTSGTTSYSFDMGWNEVDLPFLPVDRSVTNVFSSLTFGSDYDQVSFMDPGTGEWKHYVNDAEFNDFDTITEGIRYYIYVTNPAGASSSVSGDFVGATISNECDTLVAADEASFVYGPDGERVKKTADDGVHGSKTTKYIGSGYEIRDASGTNEVAVKSIFLGDFRIAEMRSDGKEFFLHTDHLNSTNVITSANSEDVGQEVQLYEYAPYGSTTRDESSESLTTDHLPLTTYKFTGQEEDAEVGLYYYHARYYDPELGRFIQADSIVQSPYDPQTLNRYAYCRNNPIKFTDPSGNIFGLIVAAILIIAAGAMAAYNEYKNGGNFGDCVKAFYKGAGKAAAAVVVSMALGAAVSFIATLAGPVLGNIITIGVKIATIGRSIYQGIQDVKNDNYVGAAINFASAAKNTSELTNSLFNGFSVGSGKAASSKVNASLCQNKTTSATQKVGGTTTTSVAKAESRALFDPIMEGDSGLSGDLVGSGSVRNGMSGQNANYLKALGLHTVSPQGVKRLVGFGGMYTSAVFATQMVPAAMTVSSIEAVGITASAAHAFSPNAWSVVAPGASMVSGVPGFALYQDGYNDVDAEMAWVKERL